MQQEIRKIAQYQLFSAINNDVDFGAHTHDYYEIIIVLENNFLHTINGIEYRHAVGDVIILRPMDWHHAQPEYDKARKIRDIYASSELFEEVCTHLSPTLLDEIKNTSDNIPPIFNLTKNELYALNDKLRTTLFADNSMQYQNLQYPLVIKRSVISELLGIYCTKRLQKEKYIPECIFKLLNQMQEPCFQTKSISEMAYELGYSHTYLCAQFKSCFGITIQQFLIERKLEKASELLTSTNDSVESISKSLGWNKTSSFIQQFKTYHNQTPFQYRKSYAKDYQK